MLIEMEELWCGGDGGFFNIWWGLDWAAAFIIHFYFTIPLS